MECPKCRAEIETKKPEIYWMVKLSVVCFVAFIISLVALIVLKNRVIASDFEGVFITGFILTALVASSVLAIISLLKISISNNSIKGQTFAFIIVFFSTIFMLPVGLMNEDTRYRSVAHRMICGTNLSNLGKAMLVYANDNNGQLPEAENWCNLLITNEYVHPETFICKKSGAKLCESSYALNKEATGMNIADIPPDMVVLFETNLGISESGRDFRAKNRKFDSNDDYKISKFTKVYEGRWNQVGGPESLAIDNHQGDGCNILFGDFHVRFEKKPWSSDLKWSLRKDYVFKLPKFTQPDPEKIRFLLLFKKVRISVIAIIVIGCAFYSLFTFQFRKYWGFAILLGLTSMVLGCFFGVLASTLYSSDNIFRVGTIAGSTAGFIVGICYFAILTKTFYSMKQQKKNMSYAVSSGIAAGMICSIILHLVLMIMAEEKRPFGLITGLPVGIIVGAILGAISGAECEKKIIIEPVD